MSEMPEGAKRLALEAEYIDLRNSLCSRPKEHEGKRAWNAYYDWLNDSEELANCKSSEELIDAIERMKEEK